MPRALIVEDEPEANELLAMLVQLRGYQTDSAYTGGEALVKVEQARPDIVFLDLMLPDINGFDVCRALKQSRKTCAIPVVMVTARLAQGNQIQGLRVGATDYVPKPYTPDQIFVAMARADAWTRHLTEENVEGQIRIGVRSEMVHFVKITRLWSLLLNRTPLGEDDARAIDHVLVEIASRAVEWGLRTGGCVVAILDYRCDHSELVLTLRAPGGWFLEDSPSDPEQLGGLIAQGGFDEVTCDESAGQVVMIRRFRA